MASGRLFIPGELKIFHGGTPVLAPQPGGHTTLNRFVNTKTLNKTKYTKVNPDHTVSKKKLTQY
ncbi:hypothetical protein ACVGWK_01800, partial [Enterobacter sichuanensis]